MAEAVPLLSPDNARCQVLRIVARPRAWRWDDLEPEPAPTWLGQPTLPFDSDVGDVPCPLGDEVPEEVRRLAAALARTVAEVLSGQRPAQQLSRWLDDPPLQVLTSAVRHTQRQPLTVASIHLQLTPGGSVEVSLRLDRGVRSSAAAFRLDERRGRWRCTALVVGP